MIAAPAMWSIAGVITRHLDAARGFDVTFWRSVFSSLCVAGGMLVQQGWRGSVTTLRGLGKVDVFSGLMWCTMYVAFMISLTKTTVANTLIVMSVAPLLTAFLAWVVLKQRIPGRTWLAIAAAMAGMAWMFVSGLGELAGGHLIGMLIGLAVPVASATNLILIKRAGQGVDLIPAVFLGSVFSALLMLPFASPLQASWHDIGLLAVLGVFQLGLPCMLMVKAARHLSAPEVALLSLLEVLLGPIWAWLGAGEVPAHETLVGGAIVMAALVVNEVAGIRGSMSASRRTGEMGSPPSRG
ncbi:DMT family transporter [Noviherbaspirillum sp. 17J57-3]|uniref:DMT family transporter n=2 Tax=Noviherbaspirillum galbum TaxID=2709383 RepID=A0A6B3SRW0_9BURK|nr:DMT family transporter [Noviherbaspirillum galbum]